MIEFSTLREVYDNSIRNFSANKAFGMLDGQSYTYEAFDQEVRRVQQMLLEADVHPGDKVAIFARSMATWPAAYFACVTIGIVAVPILPDFTAAELSKLIEHSESKALFVGSRLRPLVSDSILEKLNLTVLADDFSIIRKNVSVESTEIMKNSPAAEDLAVIIYTSGTTSSPKGVMLTHKALAMQLNMYPGFYAVKSSDVFLSILPLSHTYECSIGMLYPFMAGAQVVYLDKAPTATVLMAAFAKVRPTVLISVPLVIEKVYRSAVVGKITKTKTGKNLYRLTLVRKIYHLLAGKKLKQAFGGRLRFLGIGGAKLNSAAERFLHEGHIPYAIGYGLTETAPLLCSFAPGDEILGTVGPVPSPLIKLKIDSPNPNTGEGELMVQTPSLMKGYYKNPEATAEAITPDGWFHTKDIATIDKLGYVTILGRTNYMIVGPSGENIYPEEIENVLNSNNFVSESLVIMDKGHLVALVVYDSDKVGKLLKSAENKDEFMAKLDEKLRSYVNKRVNSFSRIASVEGRWEPFEKTPTQKIRRNLYLR